MSEIEWTALDDVNSALGADLLSLSQSGILKNISVANLFASPPAIGGTTPAAGTFTALAASADSTIGGTIVAGSKLNLPQEDDAVTPTLSFGDGDTGFYESSDNQIRVALSGISRFYFFADQFFAATATGAGILDKAALATTPTILPSRVDTDTGIGSAALDQLSLIAGGVEGIRITEAGGITSVDINQGTNDSPFFDLQATADGDATSAISTLTTSGGTTHHIQIEINGTTAWIAASTTDPSA